MKSEGKTCAWLKKLQANLYVAKIVADKADDNKNNRRQALGEFFANFSITMWGKGQKREEMLQTTVETVRKFRFEDDDVMALSNFFTNKWDTTVQGTYLKVHLALALSVSDLFAATPLLSNSLDR